MYEQYVHTIIVASMYVPCLVAASDRARRRGISHKTPLGPPSFSSLCTRCLFSPLFFFALVPPPHRSSSPFLILVLFPGFVAASSHCRSASAGRGHLQALAALSVDPRRRIAALDARCASHGDDSVLAQSGQPSWMRPESQSEPGSALLSCPIEPLSLAGYQPAGPSKATTTAFLGGREGHGHPSIRPSTAAGGATTTSNERHSPPTQPERARERARPARHFFPCCVGAAA